MNHMGFVHVFNPENHGFEGRDTGCIRYNTKSVYTSESGFSSLNAGPKWCCEVSYLTLIVVIVTRLSITHELLDS